MRNSGNKQEYNRLQEAEHDKNNVTEDIITNYSQGNMCLGARVPCLSALAECLNTVLVPGYLCPLLYCMSAVQYFLSAKIVHECLILVTNLSVLSAPPECLA